MIKRIGLILLVMMMWVRVAAAQVDLASIGEVQGDGASSPFVGKVVSFEGVVTAVNERSGSNGLGYTLFVQDARGTADLYTDTSDGVAVFVGRDKPDLRPGDHVRVTGEIIEFYDLTEVGLNSQSIDLLERDHDLPAATAIKPLTTTDDPGAWLEAHEGMLVRVDGGAAVSQSPNQFCEFEITVGGVSLPVMNSTNVDCDAFVDVQAGGVVTGVFGVLHYSFDQYRIMQTMPLTVTEGVETVVLQTAVPIKITELLYAPLYDDDQLEWVELTNVGAAPFDVTDWRLGDEETAGGGEGMTIFPTGSVIEAGRSIVVAQTAVAFQAFYGFKPNFEWQDSDAAVPDLRPDRTVANGGVALSNAGDEMILLDAAGQAVDGVSYGGSQAVFAPPVQPVGAGESIERVPAICDSDSAADFRPNRDPSPGSAVLDGDCEQAVRDTVIENENWRPIGAIQGDGDVSPFVNRLVTFDGVVTGIHEDRNTAGITFYTLFVQDVPGTEDGDPTTSDGVPVFFGRDFPIAQIGDHVLVTGQVVEFFGLTEIADDGVKVEVLGDAAVLPDPVLLDPPASNQNEYYEQLEGMLVTAGDEPLLVLGATFDGCGLAVSMPGRPPQRVILRDADDPIDTILPVIYESDVDCSAFPDVKVGDMLQGLAGPLTYNFDQFKILQQGGDDLAVTVADFRPLPDVPAPDETQFSLISFNVENFFDGIDDTGSDAEPKLSPEEIETKQTKIAYAIGTLLHCPTVVAIQEVEKATLLEGLAATMTETCGWTYSIAHRESADGRGIDVAYLLDPTRVELLAMQLEQGCTTIDTNIDDETADCPDGQEPLFSRPPLRIEIAVEGRRYILFNNHFKSKRGGAAATEPRRIAQSAHHNQLISTILAAEPAARVIVMGDFNDFEDSAPLKTLEDGGLFNVLKRVPDAQRYSFVFSGAAQLIDGILVSPDVEPFIHSVDIIHTNADYPDAFGREITPELLPYKATDHDIPYVIFRLDELDEGEGVLVAAADDANDLNENENDVPAVRPTPLIMSDDTDSGTPLWMMGIGALALVFVVGGLGWLVGRQSGSQASN